MAYEHKPVLFDEVLEALAIRADGFYIDGTFGRGGHSRAILQRLGPQGQLLAFDKDPDALRTLDTSFSDDDRFELIHGSFTMMQQTLQDKGKLGQVHGILFDFGVSSPQLDDAERGFSFRHDAPLDMRMNNEAGMTVADWLNTAKQNDIADVIYQYGEERASRRIAKAIVAASQANPVTHTKQLADIVKRVMPVKKHDIHPATKTFQALRIFINRELDDIENVLPQSLDALTNGGRLAAISFHSLEDRIVKRFIRHESRPEALPPELPVMPDNTSTLKPIGKKIRAQDAELEHNPRARSAILRVAERIRS